MQGRGRFWGALRLLEGLEELVKRGEDVLVTHFVVPDMAEEKGPLGFEAHFEAWAPEQAAAKVLPRDAGRGLVQKAHASIVASGGRGHRLQKGQVAGGVVMEVTLLCAQYVEEAGQVIRVDLLGATDADDVLFPFTTGPVKAMLWGGEA